MLTTQADHTGCTEQLPGVRVIKELSQINTGGKTFYWSITQPLVYEEVCGVT